MSQNQVICITNVDGLIGYALACRLLEGRQELQNIHVRCLCRSTEGLEELQRLGGEIMQVNYQDENKLRQAVKQARCVFLIPEHSSQRVQEAENVIKAAKQESVEHMAMKSWIGVEHVKQEHEFKTLVEYQQIEEKLKQEFPGSKHCVTRIPLLNQLFYLMTPMAETQEALRLPVKQDVKWGTIDLRDMVNAIFNLIRDQSKQPSFGTQKQVIRLTPEQNLKGEQIARGMALSLEKDPQHFKYKQISDNEWEEYMRERRNDPRYKNRPQSEGGTEKPYTMPIGRYFNDGLIQELNEWFKLASQQKVDVTTKDLQELLQHAPINLEEYFKSNREQFRRFR
ncbi:hypothetical protein BDA99DRAFT_503307 [Phascolomyces articulosus]|uniref:NmrA-like domain-containing protein n=1 Tax=Phascolomyces articulosus TaxID=60185 RepID=A0AAD5KFI3_9FUNG|nr:hypothetical protein BDA99DRAFT_503307 [Phascolomyces articulosus]